MAQILTSSRYNICHCPIFPCTCSERHFEFPLHTSRVFSTFSHLASPGANYKSPSTCPLMAPLHHYIEVISVIARSFAVYTSSERHLKFPSHVSRALAHPCLISLPLSSLNSHLASCLYNFVTICSPVLNFAFHIAYSGSCLL